MMGYSRVFLKTKVVALILAFVFMLSGLGCGPIIVFAQQPPQGMEPMQGMNQTGFTHNQYQHTGHGTHRTHHAGQYGNQTGGMIHQYGQNGTWMMMGNGTRMMGNGTWMDNGTHHYGNQTGFKMPQHFSQNSTLESNGNSSMNQNVVTNSSSNQIPSWVRNNAKWWSQNQVGDSDFIQGVQYLIQQGILKIPPTQVNQTSSSQQIPAWVKTNAGWWAQGQISDGDFIKGIQYLVSSGIVKIT